MRLAASIFFASALACAAAQDIAGRWEGSIQIPSREFNLIVDFAPDGNGWIGSVIIPGLGVKGAPLTEIATTKSVVSFAIKGALASERTGSARLKGSLTGDGEMRGEFVQAGNRAPFFLRRTGPPQVELPRKSTVVSKDFVGEWKGDYEMNGYPRHVTLTLANNQPNGAATAQLTVVGKRTTKPPVDLVMEENGFLTIESHEIGITYEGRFRKESAEIKGTFSLGAFELPLTLRRTP